MILQYQVVATGHDQLKRVIRSVDRELEKSSSRSTTSVSRAARAQRAAVDKSTKGMARGFGDIAKVAARIERQRFAQEQRNIKSSERARIAAERRVSEERRRAQIRATNQAIREARREERARKNARRSFAKGVVSGTGSRLARPIGLAKNAAVGGGAILTGAALHESISTDSAARRLIINARGPGEKGLMAPGELAGRIATTAGSSASSQEQIAAGLGAFVEKTGDLKTAVDNMGVFADVATATGASFEDVASAAADLSTKMDISSIDDMKKAFAILTFQGKQGAFELRNMAAEFPELLAAAKSAGIGGVKGVSQFGGFLQIARGGIGSAEETTTAVNAVFGQLAAKAGDIQSGKALGKKVQVFEGGDTKGNLRNFQDVITDVIAGSGGDEGKLIKLFDKRGIKAIRPLLSTFKEARDAAGGGKAGRDAGIKAMVDQMDKAAASSGTYSDILDDAKDALKGNAAELALAFKQTKIAIATELMPVTTDLLRSLAKLAPHVREVAEAVAGAADFLASSPWEGLGIVIAGAFTAEIAKAGIAKLLKMAIIGGGGGGAGVGGAVGLAGKGIKAGTGLVGAGAGALSGIAAAGGAAGAAVIAGTALAATAGVTAAIFQGYKLIEENFGDAHSDEAARERAGFGGEEGRKRLAREFEALPERQQKKIDAGDAALQAAVKEKVETGRISEETRARLQAVVGDGAQQFVNEVVKKIKAANLAQNGKDPNRTGSPVVRGS